MFDGEFDLVLDWCVFGLVYVLDVIGFYGVFEYYGVGIVGDFDYVIGSDLEGFVV